MKKLIKVMLGIATMLGGLILAYLFLLQRDIQKVDDFCKEMQPGLAVTQIPIIAQKYAVSPRGVQDPDSIKNRTLGIEIKERPNTWFFAVAAPMTVGEHACGVYHNYQVVLSASASG